MKDAIHRAIAIVGTGAVLPDAANVAAFWQNVKSGRDSITEVSRERWDPALYYDADPAAPDKTYSKIGGWVRQHVWDPMKWRLPIPPRVAAAMDEAQQWAISCTRAALEDYGYPKRAVDGDRTAVILGSAIAGEKQYITVLRLYFPEYARELAESPTFAALPERVRREISRELQRRIGQRFPEITEDTMPGELANCIAGRIANLYNFHGPNFVCDAACASAMAAISAAVDGLVENEFDLAVTGGIDRNMGPSTFIKFSKIGALSATGSRPYAAGADGFVMGEGAVVFLLKRLADAERDGDKIHAVLRGIGGSSDGKGKGITAPNPIGQKFAIERAWEAAGLSPATATMIEGHGTSTRVGDVVEFESIASVLAASHAAPQSVALGSVKSNVGHLKGASGAAGLLKTVLSLREKLLPPSIHCEHPNPDIDFAHSPLYVNTELKPWTVPADLPRRAGVSAFGFGGTNFHLVLEEHIPGRLGGNGKRSIAVGDITAAAAGGTVIMRASDQSIQSSCKAPFRGALVIGAATEAALAEQLRSVQKKSEAGEAPAPAPPAKADLEAKERIAIDYADAAELARKSAAALKALSLGDPAMWKALRAQGIFRGRGSAPKVAFLYTGQGSQYVNMMKALRASEPIVAETFAEADRVMTPLLGKPLSEFIFINADDPAAVAQAEEGLRQTAITQPAVLATDLAMTRLLDAYGIQPDMTMGHSLGEYGALVAAGGLPFADALEAVSARGREMTRVALQDNGRMAAVFAPLQEVERILKTVDGYVVIANINSERQSVIGGATKAVEQAMVAFQKAGYEVSALNVSHAFHTSIVAPASEPLRQTLDRLHLQPAQIPVVANVNGEFYPMGPEVRPLMLDILAKQVASPVQFVKGLHTLYEAGARVFVETGPKKALQGFAEDVLGEHDDVISLFTNHPKLGDIVSLNQALCGMYAAGLGRGVEEPAREVVAQRTAPAPPHPGSPSLPANGDRLNELGRLFAGVLERGWEIYGGKTTVSAEPVVVTGAALGLPGTERVFDDGNVARILHGEQFIDVIPTRFRRAMLDKHITRLVKSEAGGASFETISKLEDVIKLAARGREFDLEKEFGVSAERLAALDQVTRLAIGAGLDALRDAGIPLVMRYKTTSKGTQLPDRWGLPDALRDETGVIFASAFPGYDSLIEQLSHYFSDQARREQIETLEQLRARAASANGHSVLGEEIKRRLDELRAAVEKDPYIFDRRFLFRVLSMGHSQFAEFIGARGPNTQINSACASTTQATSLAEDWIRAGRCRRVIVISADDVTSDHMLEWFGAGFLASGAAATDETVEEAAIPFDRRRHGLIIGMGAASMVVERAEAARDRGLRPICEILASLTANSAFHGTRLDVQHISDMMEALVAQAEQRGGITRSRIAPRTMFMSHETYTPARGGSASAEIHALRRVFGHAADQVVIANTKGFTGHAMGTGIEDVVAIKAMETGCVPPVANFKEVDPELGALNLSRGGFYPVEYVVRLGAGFGSQVSLSLLRWLAPKDGTRQPVNQLGYSYRIADPATWNAWLKRITGQPSVDLEVVQRTLRVRGSRVATGTPVKAEVRPAQVESKPLPVIEPVNATSKTVSPAPAPAANVIAPPPAPAKTAEASVKQRILALVVEKTGYPEDMLDLDLDLEADLGIDTVKQAEMFAAIREMYNIPRDETRKLRDYPTLAHVIRFVYEKRPDLAAGGEAVSAPDDVKEKILSLVVEKTGYPKDMLDLDLDLEADLGIDTVKQAEMFAAIRETYNIPRDENRKLRDYPTLAHVIRFVYEKRPDLIAVTVPAAPASVPSPATTQSAADDEVKERVLAIVAEKTGYPKDMLDLDLDLEADLGIDTVKQAEMFAAIRAAYSIPRDENLKLRDFPTLAHVIKFARDRRQATTAAAATTVETRPETAPRARPLLATFDAADRIPRRVPTPALRPPLAMCKSTGVRLERGRRIVVMPDEGGVARALADRLHKEGIDVLELERTANADAIASQLKTWMAAGPVHGTYWLPALDVEKPVYEMNLPAWHEALRLRLKAFYAAMRVLYEPIGPAGTFLISATRLGGQHGYDAAGAVAPLGGAVAGFTKAYKRERLDALVKVVDFEAKRAPVEVANALIEETLRDPGAVEIGYKDSLRWTVGLQERPASDGQPGLIVNKDTVFLVTGAAGSIVSAITADLAAASGGIFYLLDLVPEPDPNNSDIARFTTDKENLKRDLFTRIQKRGERATPALVDKELAALERAHAALSAIEAVRAAGGTAHYASVNLTDAEAVARVIQQVRERSGRIDVLLHAAGLERSHFLPDKDSREFDLVFDVKSNGWFNLLRAIGDMPLGATVAFSSVAGRFGNAGQTDYSSANDLLCKLTSNLRTIRPATRGIVVDWTAWGGIGMATRGSIPKMMEVAGIDMLPPEGGIPLIRRELTTGGTRGEVVIGLRLGVLTSEWDDTGGLEIRNGIYPIAGRIAAAGMARGVVIETILDPKSQPFLFDHRIDGTPVLPGVMGIEAFAEAALSLLPGWSVAAIEDVNFAAPFKFYRDEPRTIRVESKILSQPEGLVAECALIGKRSLPNQAEPQATIHFTGRVRLSKQPFQGASAPAPGGPRGAVMSAADIYHVFFHGPSFQVVERAWRDGERMIGQFAKDLPPDHQPANVPLLMMPRLIELCFQTAGLWEIVEHHRFGLPLHLDQVCIGRMPDVASGTLYAVVTPKEQGSFNAEVVDAAGNCYVRVGGYRTVALPGSVVEPVKTMQVVA
ncbi:MAG: SDR family NAD(P)-dependent oxidoreductase [Terriglobales bacterium]